MQVTRCAQGCARVYFRAAVSDEDDGTLS